ncbi:MAG: hypothetical protein LBF22_15105 [Deltaproteobacteria bacterium]|jgi:hypothetical protein|nr:hypothetical protein [Deltaproteobacteria bacterium]
MGKNIITRKLLLPEKKLKKNVAKNSQKLNIKIAKNLNEILAKIDPDFRQKVTRY